MKVLIITSEELNQKNRLSSIFELTQAKALQQQGVDVAIVSVGYLAVSDLLKSLLRKQKSAYRYISLGAGEKLQLLFQVALKSLLNKVNIKKWNVEGVDVYEGLLHRFFFRMNEKAHRQWVDAGYKAFQLYRKENGSPDVVHAHSRFLLGGMLGQKIKKKTGLPYVLTEHSSFYARGLVQPFQKPLIKNVIEDSAHFFVVSQSFGALINQELQTDYPFDVLPNMLDQPFENVEVKSKTKDEFVVLTVGSLEPVKNHELLLDAFKILLKKIPAAKLRIVGGGSLENALKNKAGESGIADQVFFTGTLHHEQVKEEMLNASLFVLPSRSETFGAVVTEALACGLPVVTTRCGGPEEIINESNGVLTEQNAPELAKAMESVLHHLHQYDTKQIRQNCLQRYSGPAIASRLIQVYKNFSKQAATAVA